MRLLNLLIPTLASVILFSLTFPLTRIRVLAWVALVPYLVALRRARLREALLLGGICGVLSAYSIGLWFPTAFSSYYDQPLLLGVAFLAYTRTRRLRKATGRDVMREPLRGYKREARVARR